ncbi:MAG: bifunctional glycosyltransferase family 2/GtrA family protein [Clostridia bacterium]|nr:bifunctional glycosyltransferase family 2/GtrA family protein [Clostridia bacterium]
MSTVIVPAYNPDEKLLEVIKDIKSYNIDRIIVVNDGSKKECDEIFNSIKSEVILLIHEINKGKGVALKTAMKYIKELGIEDKVLTIDADGQHKIEDGIKLLENLESGKKEFVTGSRTFKEKIPLKNRIGNVINSYTFMLLSGKKVKDTLNGLRAFNTNLIEFLLEVEGERYEYEMNVIIQCAKNKINIKEVPIDVVYHEGENTSHFRAIIDSIRIYGTMLVYLGSSFISFIIDYIVFILTMAVTKELIISNVIARVISATCNFLLNSKIVFRQKKITIKQVVQYAFLAIFVLVINTTLLQIITNKLPLPALTKVITEVIILAFNYIIQKKLIFKNKNK